MVLYHQHNMQMIHTKCLRGLIPGQLKVFSELSRPTWHACAGTSLLLVPTQLVYSLFVYIWPS